MVPHDVLHCQHGPLLLQPPHERLDVVEGSGVLTGLKCNSLFSLRISGFLEGIIYVDSSRDSDKMDCEMTNLCHVLNQSVVVREGVARVGDAELVDRREVDLEHSHCSRLL